MTLSIDNNIKILVSPDSMEAVLTLVPCTGYTYNLEEILAYLKENGVTMGLKTDRIRQMIDGGIYNTPIVVAVGTPAEDGENGRFEFEFDTEFEVKPAIAGDGSVDFRNTKMFVSVKKGDVLARYTGPTPGKFGFDVRGVLLKPKKGKPLAALRGRGFEISEDGAVYSAKFDGKVEYQYGQLNVSNVYEHKGDLDLTDGNIQFAGDVHVSGNVISGMSIEAGGNVEIDGHVGGATIISGADVMIKGGMQGNGKGTIKAKGDVMGRFFEETIIRCEGKLSTNYLLNCDTYARGQVYVEGRQGTVVGGVLHAVHGIYSSNAGNASGRKTMLRIGVGDELLDEYRTVKANKENVEEELESVSNRLGKLEKIIKASPSNDRQMAFNKLLQSKVLRTAELKQISTEVQRLTQIIEEAALAEIQVKRVLYTGVSIGIGLQCKAIENSCKAVRIRFRGDEIYLEGI